MANHKNLSLQITLKSLWLLNLVPSSMSSLWVVLKLYHRRAFTTISRNSMMSTIQATEWIWSSSENNLLMNSSSLPLKTLKTWKTRRSQIIIIRTKKSLQESIVMEECLRSFHTKTRVNWLWNGTLILALKNGSPNHLSTSEVSLDLRVQILFNRTWCLLVLLPKWAQAVVTF